MGTSADSPLARWTAPECPFTVEYVPRVLDDIRLAVVDAFYSLPRGGVEIGGILLGRAEPGRVIITGSMALECEHALGPSFTLSETDKVRLGEMIASAAGDTQWRPVGWYLSHTRTQIFLSESDLEIHKRFFPEAWQVALVLKPHTFLPTKAGFFFTGEDGTVRSDASFREFQLEPLPIGRVPTAEPARDASAPVPEPAPVPPAPTNGRVIDISQAAKPENVYEPAEPEHEPAPAPSAPAAFEPPPSPMFAAVEPPRSRGWVAPLAVLLGLAVGAAGFLTRQVWTGRWTAATPAGIVSQGTLGLTAADQDGQLQIRWDGSSPDVQRSTAAMLLISDGPQPHTVALDPVQVRGGSYRYARHADHVDVILSLSEPGGDKLVQAAGFTKVEAPAPAPAPVAAEPAAPAATDKALRKEMEQLRAENANLKAANKKLTESNHRMEQYVETDRAEHQRKRLENQATGK